MKFCIIFKVSGLLMATALSCAVSGCTDRQATHAYSPRQASIRPSIEQAFTTTCFEKDALTCFEKDAFEDRAVNDRARQSLEGLIDLASGKHTDHKAVFDDSFATKPTVSYDVIIPFDLNNALRLIRDAIRVDYRHRGQSNMQGYAIRYLEKTPFRSSCIGDTALCNYASYNCGEINVEMIFYGPKRVFRISSLSLGRAVRWQTLESLSAIGTAGRFFE